MSSQRHRFTFLRAIVAIALAQLFSLGFLLPMRAADFTVADGDVAGLIAAINAANQRGAPTTIVLANDGTYLLTVPDPLGGPAGPTGLPSITGIVQIIGNGSEVKRSNAGGVPSFRILHVAPGGELTLRNLSISGGAAVGETPISASDGGGVFVSPAGKVILEGCSIDRNFADFLGGGILADGTVVVKDSTITNNIAIDGGGIFCGYNGDLTVAGSTLAANRGSFGGGLFNDNGGVVHLEGSTFVDNHAAGWGGAIATVGFGSGADTGTMLTANRLQIHDNSAAVGGGFFRNIGSAEIANSAIYHNSASAAGGGVFNDEAPDRAPGQLLLTNSTVSGNHANVRGGGLFSAAPLRVGYSTLAENEAPDGGNVFAVENGLAPAVSSTIIARNLGGHDCTGPITSQGHNLDGDGTCHLAADGDIANTDPKLGPLAENGGPTLTQALLPGSPALDTGDNDACPAADQRGVSRPQGPGCDIGAYEVQGVFVGACSDYYVYEVDGNYQANGWQGAIQVGDKRKNTLRGTTGPDLILGMRGNDLIDGKGGNDVVCGGEGNDFLLGKDGNDYLDGERGNDVLNGGKGDYDQLLAGEGNDTLLDGDGVGRAAGAAGNDNVMLALHLGWRSPDGQARFSGLTAGYGNDAVSLALVDPTPFVVDLSGDEYDNPPSPREGKNDLLALSGVAAPGSTIIKFERQVIAAAVADQVLPADEDGAEFLAEPVGEAAAGPEPLEHLFLPLLAP
jgi:Ca2+-binding RTX toxin-like protein